ncbi:MAG: hypothetical protein J0I84_18715 [Terrimonas sp.]|nr:hypothetical protein [Terrimonas sp.]OJY92959.1 MAG: hypothetical protein BGP13_21475 [Sphingobacteriales bacterium 40-81]
MKLPFKPILLTWIIAGTADALAAIMVYAWILNKTTVLQIFQGIASGIAGKDAFNGGAETAVLGLLLHYFIALCWVMLYFLLYPRFKFLQKNIIASAIIYGLFVWLFMNIIVLPVTFGRPPVLTMNNIFTGSIMLMFAIGLPVSIIADHYFRK